jgi:hypothetical protein
VRAHLYDDVPERPATSQIAARRLDGYDLEVGTQLPFVPWARLRASRYWHTAVNGETVTTCDRIGLRLNPLPSLEIETGAQRETEHQSWFARLRWRIKLDD